LQDTETPPIGHLMVGRTQLPPASQILLRSLPVPPAPGMVPHSVRAGWCWQVPVVHDRSQMPLHAVLQQTPKAQKLLAHSVPVLHVSLNARFTQMNRLGSHLGVAPGHAVEPWKTPLSSQSWGVLLPVPEQRCAPGTQDPPQVLEALRQANWQFVVVVPGQLPLASHTAELVSVRPEQLAPRHWFAG
jgi:hypothetical protein